MFRSAKFSTVAVVLCTTVFAQDTASRSQNDLDASYSANFVKGMIPFPNTLAGFQLQAAASLGDRIAIALARTQPKTVLYDPNRADEVLTLIGMSFGKPDWTKLEENRNPGVSLLMLNTIAREAQDASVKTRAQGLIKKLEALPDNKPLLFDTNALAQSAASSSQNGDRVAVSLAKTQPGTTLNDADKLNQMLDLIGKAFEKPDAIGVEENRNPGVSLLLLDTIAAEAQDAAVRSRAQDLTNKLKALPLPAAATH